MSRTRSVLRLTYEPACIETWPPDDIKAHINFMHRFNKELAEAGEFFDAQGLALTEEARVVRARPRWTLSTASLWIYSAAMSDEPAYIPTPYELQYGDHIPQGLESARAFLASKGEFVLFVDVLGFADLVERDEEEYVAWAATLSPLRASMRTPPKSPLQVLFQAFHRALETTLSGQGTHKSPAIVFSDSAFITEKCIHRTLDVARSLMRRLIVAGVPSRMGLGFGGFDAARFSTETVKYRTHHVSEFYGTAVIRAHKAESCKIPGMRVLLHESAYARINDSRVVPRPITVNEDPVPSWLTIPLLATSPQYGVTQELNYLPALPADEPLEDHVREMRNRAPEAVHRHYDETLAAIQRMRESRG